MFARYTLSSTVQNEGHAMITHAADAVPTNQSVQRPVPGSQSQPKSNQTYGFLDGTNLTELAEVSTDIAETILFKN